jgi:hypothetical protein
MPITVILNSLKNYNIPKLIPITVIFSPPVRLQLINLVAEMLPPQPSNEVIEGTE